MSEAAARVTQRRPRGGAGVRDVAGVDRRSLDERTAARGPYVGRRRLDRVLDEDWLVAVLVAPPGYGKSVAAQAWIERSGARVAAVVVDRLTDDEARARLLEAAHWLCPGVGAVYRSDGSGLIDTLADDEVEGPMATLLVDCPQPLDDTPIWELVTELVDGVRPRLRVLVMCQVDPPLPIVRWRAQGIVRVLREGDLRFGDEEAIAAAAALGLNLATEAVVDLNRRVEGWPLAFTLALMATGDEWSPDGQRPELLVDSLVAAVVDQLSPRHREIALALSVFEWFDDALAVSLIGAEARPVLAELRRRHLVELAEPGLGLRFHGLVRQLLDAELSWHDPDRHSQLHQRAAEYWLRQGQLEPAYRHLTSLRDRAAVHRLVVEPALALVDRGDRAGLGRLLAALPRTSSIDDSAVALDLAAASFFSGDRRAANRWIERAEIIGLADDALVMRAHSTRAILALMDGRLVDASRESQRFLEIRPRTGPGGPLEERFGLVAARLALLRLDVVAAQTWIDQVSGLSIPPVVRDVTIPGLQAWHDSLVGLTHRAMEWATRALEHAAALGTGAHHGSFDATVAAAGACLRAGDLARAERLAAQALSDGAQLGYDWNIVRSAEVTAQTHVASRRPAEALAVIADARRRLAVPASELAGNLTVAEAVAAWMLGRTETAIGLLAGILDRPDGRLARAAIALEAGDDGLVGDMLGGTESWLLPDRIEASLLTAVVAGDEARLAVVVEDASATGLLLPFLGRGRRVEAALLGLSLEAVHPALIEHLRRPDQGVVRNGRVASLTARELSILDLLPSHLTYAEIAQQLEVSVNTVKGNLKSIYRKLEVSARADAVDVARGTGII